jgi:midasin (ATPase involved in ribosome maturation)
MDCSISLEDRKKLSGILEYVQKFAYTIQRCYGALLDQNILAYKAHVKYTYINIRIFRNLLAKGFCQNDSKDNDEKGDGEGSKQGPTEWEDDVEGTGMGEGEGNKDVSDQITNEEQLLDLKNSLQEQQKDQSKSSNQQEKLGAKEQDEHGVEMDQDFEGDMFDMNEQQDEQDDNESNDSEDSIDRELDHNKKEMNLDNVVSEKQWGSDDGIDENENNEENGKEKFERNNAMQGPSLEDEMHTKEDKSDDENDEKSDIKKEKKSSKKQDEKAQVRIVIHWSKLVVNVPCIIL